MSSILVVGATGYLGRSILSSRTRDTIFGTSRQPSRGLVTLEPIDTDAVVRHVESLGASAIVNLAGRSSGSPDELKRANIDVVASLLDVARLTGARLVTVGSAAECGATPTAEPIDESSSCRPLSDYGRTKLHATELTRLAAVGGTEATVARLFNLIGPKMPVTQPASEFHEAFCRQVADPIVLTVRNASTVRDFVTVEFAVTALMALIGASHPPPPLVNICSGQATSFRSLVEAIATHLGRRVVIDDLHEALAVPHCVGMPSLLETITGLTYRGGPADLARVLCAG